MHLNATSALARSAAMAAFLAPIKDEVICDVIAASPGRTYEQAEASFDAFLQWAALIPEVAPGRMYVMLKTPADDVFHALLARQDDYNRFCDAHLGVRVKHHPLDDHARMSLDGAVEHTVGVLEQVYGDKLHPSLKDWRQQLDAGAAIVSCVSCPSVDEMAGSVVGDLPNGGRVVH